MSVTRKQVLQHVVSEGPRTQGFVLLITTLMRDPRAQAQPLSSASPSHAVTLMHGT